jgi:sugar phosphate isomerase/epimerase
LKHPALSISTAFNYDVAIDEQIPVIAAAGFSHVSLGAQEDHSGYLTASGRKRLKGLLQQHRLTIDTIHGPRMDLPDSIDRLSAVASAAVELDVPVVVVHAGPFAFEAPELPDYLNAVLQTGKEVESIARNTGITFALENVLPGPATELVREALLSLDPKYFGFCYDSSHDQIGGPKPFDLLADFSHRVCAVHLSDRIADYVDHVPPGEGVIQWEALAKALRASVFTGPLLFEVMITHASQKESWPFLELAYRQASWVYSLMEQAA